MRNPIRFGAALFTVALLAACASAPRIQMDASARDAVQRIALANAAEPDKYQVYPGRAPGGSLLFAFGAIGGAVLGGIESNRIESASTRFMTAVAPYRPSLTDSMLDHLEQGLKEKGYDVLRVPRPPLTQDKKSFDVSGVVADVDAVLVANPQGGYILEDGEVSPNIGTFVTLLRPNDNHIFLVDRYYYNKGKVKDGVQIIPEPQYSFASLDALYADGEHAAQGLEASAQIVAAEILKAF